MREQRRKYLKPTGAELSTHMRSLVRMRWKYHRERVARRDHLQTTTSTCPRGPMPPRSKAQQDFTRWERQVANAQLVRLALERRNLLARFGRDWGLPIVFGAFNSIFRPTVADLRGEKSAAWRMLNRSCGRRDARMINLDVTLVTGPDVVGDGYRLPFREGTFDVIFCDYVIEHVPGAESILRAVRRALRPRGLFSLEVPFHQPVHGEADFPRWTQDGFVRAAERSGL